MSTSSTGRRGEDAAAAFLERHGYRILARNYRTPDGEADMVCLDGVVLVIVEVKFRRKRSYGAALSAVDRRKRAKLRRIAADLAQIAAPGRQIRFDVVAIDGNHLTVHRNAF